MRLVWVLLFSGAVLAQDVEELVEAAYGDAYEGRVAALRALRDAGPKARAAVHPLRELRGTGHDRRIHVALAAIGTAGVPEPKFAGASQAELIEALRSNDARTRGQAAYYLRRYASRNRKLVKPLAAALDHPSAYARHHVHKALYLTGLAQAVFDREVQHADVHRRRLSARYASNERLLALLEDDDRTVRRRAVLAAGSRRLRPAAPRLLELTHGELRMDAWFALALMQSPDVVPLLARALGDPDAGVRTRASEYLGYIRDADALAPAVQPLARALFDDVWPVRMNAYRALGKMRAKAAAIAPVLAEIAEASVNDRAYAQSTLTRIGAGIQLPAQPKAGDLDALLAQLAEPGTDEAGRAAFQLGRLRSADARVLAALRRALASENAYVRRHAAYALERIGVKAIPTLIEVLLEGDASARRLAIEPLRRLALLEKQPPPELFHKALADEDPEVRRIAAVTLGDLGWKRAVPDLVRLAEKGDGGAIWALASLGPGAAPAVPVLTARLARWEDRSKEHVDASIRALGAIGPAAEPAVPLIVDAALWGQGVDSTALTALVAMGAPGHAGIVEVIERGKGHVRRSAIERLMEKNFNPPGLRAALERAVKDPIAKTAALRALSQFTADEPVDVASLMAAMEQEPAKRYAGSVVPHTLAKIATPDQLLPYLDDEDERKRWCAWTALTKMTLTDAHRKVLEPKMVVAMREKNAVRWPAIAMLAKVPPTRITDDLLLAFQDARLQPEAVAGIVRLPGARKRVVAALGHKNLEVRRGAGVLVSSFEPQLTEALPALAQAMGDDPRHFTRYLAIVVSMREKAVPTLLAFLERSTSSQRRNILSSSTRLGDRALPILRERFKKAKGRQRFEALAMLGPFRERALPELLAAVRDEDVRLRALAYHHLGGIKGHEKEIVPALVAALPHRDAVRALGQLGTAAAAGVKQAAASPDPDVRISVMHLHGTFGAEGMARIGAALADKVPEVRLAAAQVARYLKARAQPLAPALRKAMRDSDPNVRRAAADALAAVGGDSLPVLAERFKSGDVAARREVARALAKMGERALPLLLEAGRDQDREVRRYAFGALGKMPKHAERVIPVLVEGLPDPRAAYALRALGEPGASPLKAAVRSPDPKTRAVALRIITYLKADAIPLIEAGLRDADASVRQSAAGAAAEMGASARPLARALARSLKDTDSNVRQTAAAALGRTGDDALPVLVAHIADGDYGLRRAILRVLSVSFGERGRAEVYKAARAEDPEIRKVGLRQLGYMAHALDEVVPVLVAALPHSYAESALRRLGPRAASGVRQALASKDPAVRAAGMRTVHALQGAARPYIAKGLADSSAEVRAAAAEAAVSLKYRAKPLAPALIKALKDPNRNVRVAALRALGASGGAKDAIDEIARLYREGTSSDRSAARDALTTIGAAALPHFVSAVIGDDDSLAMDAAGALARMGSLGIAALVEVMGTGEDPVVQRAGDALRARPEQGVPALMKLLAHESAAVRRNAAWRLGQTRRHAIPAIDALIKGVGDKDEFVAGQAAWALGEIGPAAKRALPALRKLVASERAVEIARASIKKISP